MKFGELKNCGNIRVVKRLACWTASSIYSQYKGVLCWPDAAKDPKPATLGGLLASLKSGDYEGFRKACEESPEYLKTLSRSESEELDHVTAMYGDMECANIVIRHSRDRMSFVRFALKAGNTETLSVVQSSDEPSRADLIRAFQNSKAHLLQSDDPSVRSCRVEMIINLLKMYPELAPHVDSFDLIADCIKFGDLEQLAYLHTTCPTICLDKCIWWAGSTLALEADHAINKCLDKTCQVAHCNGCTCFYAAVTGRTTEGDQMGVVDYMIRTIYKTPRHLEASLDGAAEFEPSGVMFITLVKAGIETGLLAQCSQENLTLSAATALNRAVLTEDQKLKTAALTILLDPSLSIDLRMEIIRAEYSSTSSPAYLTLSMMLLASSSNPDFYLPKELHDLITQISYSSDTEFFDDHKFYKRVFGLPKLPKI